MTQAIKYQTTEVDPAKSVAQIAELVRRYGGSRFETLWSESGEVTGIRFAIRHQEIGELPVCMTVRTGEIERILASSGYATGRTPAQKRERPQRIARQAERIGWRHVKDLTEQLLLAVELGLRSLPAAFLADVEAYDEATGQTVAFYELFERRARISGADPARGIELDSASPSNRDSQAIELPAGSARKD